MNFGTNSQNHYSVFIMSHYFQYTYIHHMIDLEYALIILTNRKQ